MQRHHHKDTQMEGTAQNRYFDLSKDHVIEIGQDAYVRGEVGRYAVVVFRTINGCVEATVHPPGFRWLHSEAILLQLDRYLTDSAFMDRKGNVTIEKH